MRDQLRADVIDDLDVAGVLAMCAGGTVPVNTRVDVAIAAHQAAFASYLDEGTPAAGEVFDLAMFTLRAVIVARAPTADDTRLAYLQGLPMTAWCVWRDYSAESIRNETLAAIERGLKQFESTFDDESLQRQPAGSTGGFLLAQPANLGFALQTDRSGQDGQEI
jgi:hypothetical protein